MADYLITDTQMTAMADGIRKIWAETGSMTVEQMLTKLDNTIFGIPIKDTIGLGETSGEWVRPSDWPDLDAIELPDDFDGVYLTYDLRKTPGYGWIGLWIGGNGTYYVERGHLNSNNEFIVDETHSVAQDTYFRQALDSTYGNVQLWRVTASSHIAGFGFCGDTTDTNVMKVNQLQPCVERIGYMDYAGPIWSGNGATTATNRMHSTFWLERDGLVMGRNRAITSFNTAWSSAYNLKKIDTEKWDTSKWKITSFTSNWYYCINLVNLDLSNWKTDTWAVTNFTSNWDHCISLQELDLSNWNTSNWKVTTLYYEWANCHSLQTLNLKGWDTSGWAVTTMYYTWNYCHSLKRLDIENWDVSNWNVNTLYCTWRYCKSLKVLDLSKWDTSNWEVTTLGYTWQGCNSLIELKIDDWDVSKWHVTNLAATFANLYCIKELKLNKWNTTNWEIANFSSTFSSCLSLEVLEIDRWNTSNWAVTTLESLFSYDHCLKELDLSEWDTSNWAVTNIRNCWLECFSLEKLNINDWDTSNWAVTNMYYTWNSCTALEELNISSWNTSNWAVTNTQSMFGSMTNLVTLLTPVSFNASTSNSTGFIGYNYRLVNFSGFEIKENFNINGTYALTDQSITNLVNRLPQVTSKTGTFPTGIKHRLTAEQIATMTQKGWTVA